MKNLTVAHVALCAFSLGVSVAVWASGYDERHSKNPVRVVCEQGTFEPVADDSDPYLREVSRTCNVGDANGRPAIVVVID